MLLSKAEKKLLVFVNKSSKTETCRTHYWRKQGLMKTNNTHLYGIWIHFIFPIMINKHYIQLCKHGLNISEVHVKRILRRKQRRRVHMLNKVSPGAVKCMVRFWLWFLKHYYKLVALKPLPIIQKQYKTHRCLFYLSALTSNEGMF